ncbi:MAG: hypothetical protein PHF86_10405 [Candidatus Nanoarchaeia archaeon]|jgi:hypothetical protein|nr:hypothetical protein [Candidatus Nanoarchaeia archaeon]
MDLNTGFILVNKGDKMELNVVTETKQITEKLVQIISLSPNNENIRLTIQYMNGKYIIDKSFQNNYFGKKELEQAKKNFDTEEKVKKHFNL